MGTPGAPRAAGSLSQLSTTSSAHKVRHAGCERRVSRFELSGEELSCACGERRPEPAAAQLVLARAGLADWLAVLAHCIERAAAWLTLPACQNAAGGMVAGWQVSLLHGCICMRRWFRCILLVVPQRQCSRSISISCSQPAPVSSNPQATIHIALLHK